MWRIVVGSLLSGVLGLNNAQASTYVAVGDSITSGTHAHPDWRHGVHYSWATGDLLEESFAKKVGFEKFYNVSFPGAMTSVIDYQITLTEKAHANYVSLLIGTNDVCWGLGHVVIGNIKRFVTRLEKNQNVKGIFLGTIPDLEQVYDVGRNSTYCAITTSVSCPNFMARDENYRKGVMQQIKEINQEIIALEKDFSKLHVVDQLDVQKYEPSDISTVDCFHPSKLGQQKIADAFFAAWQKANLE